MIRFACACGRQVEAKAEDVGKEARCPLCGCLVIVRDSGGIAEDQTARQQGVCQAGRLGIEQIWHRPRKLDSEDEDHRDRFWPANRFARLPGKHSGKVAVVMIFAYILAALILLPLLILL